ncbi:MAG: NAD(P)H-hydrate epimerase [Anaerolineales bacterium]|nr:NAD(P)H-hydrate epimerase [Anaerolineales bacterium]
MSARAITAAIPRCPCLAGRGGLAHPCLSRQPQDCPRSARDALPQIWRRPDPVFHRHEFRALRDFLEDSDLLLDGLFGTGIKLPWRDEATLVLRNGADLSSLDLPVLVAAVDCPSGVDCDTGARADETLRADLTLTMAAC